MNFSSDNAGPAAPQIIGALQAANSGFAPSYGSDALSARVEQRVRDIFEAPQAAVYLVATGTAANALALACLCPPWAAIYCHRHSHVEEDECGAPEFYTGGAKLVLIGGDHAKMDPSDLQETLAEAAPVGVHNVQKGAVSLTNATECGTVYSCDEIAALSAVARRHDLPVHMDGARLANALSSLGCKPSELTWRAGVDILSLGGTKNGLLAAEAVVLFDPDKAWEFELRRKRSGHLFSKHRFLAAQMDAYLEDGLWLQLAGQANRAARRLADGLRELPHATILHPPDANMVFPALPDAAVERIRDTGATFYPWPAAQKGLEADSPAPGDPAGLQLVDDGFRSRRPCRRGQGMTDRVDRRT